MHITVRPATPDQTSIISAILQEAAAWTETLGGAVMWQLDELAPERLEAEVGHGLFIIAWDGSEPAGTVRFQLQDLEFWPDEPDADAAYIHRLAVRRAYAGGVVANALMAWAVGQAAACGRSVLRLDCDAERTSLRRVYERFGFRYHSDRQVGPYLVARYELPVTGEPRR